MVDQLDQQPIRIMEVKGTSTVAMSFGLGCQRNTQLAEPIRPLIDILGTAYDKTDVMNGLNGPRLLSGRQLVKSKVVLARCKIGVFRIGQPFECHSENLRIEFDRFLNISYIQCDVSNAQNA